MTFRASFALADHAALAQRDQGRGVSVHAVAGGGAGRTDDLVALGRGRTYIIDDRIFRVKWQFLALCDQLAQAFVRRVAGRYR